MKIAYITGGSAGMYCGTCMHDNTLASALMERGHEVALIPTYTPLRLDEQSVADEHIFFGALNVYLQQKASFFRKSKMLDRVLDSRRVLGWISKLGASSTKAEDLGALTLSMLEGEEGHQARELEKLVDFLEEIVQPEVVHLSFTLFAGFARRIKERLGVPVVCSLQGEDLFFDELVEPYHSRVVDVVRSRVDDIDLFTCHSQYYRGVMERYGVPADRTVPTILGIRPDGFDDADARRSRDGRGDEPVVIGYLARQCPEKGLGLLTDAFIELARSTDPGRVRLRVAGFLGDKDRPFVEEQRRKVTEAGLLDHVDWLDAVDRPGKVDFLSSLDLFSVPAVYQEPKGVYVAEALASGVPVVLPDHGAFPEWIESTGGGLLVEPKNPSALAAGLRGLMNDAAERRRLGAAGRAVIQRDFNHGAMADEMAGLYADLVAGRPVVAAGSKGTTIDETAA
ncbi:MAG: glycosyltransferase family 4 protein [Acidobacteriota bacterium]